MSNTDLVIESDDFIEVQAKKRKPIEESMESSESEKKKTILDDEIKKKMVLFLAQKFSNKASLVTSMDTIIIKLVS